MSEHRPTSSSNGDGATVLGALPRSRPHRRSAKRGAAPEAAQAASAPETTAKTPPAPAPTARRATGSARGPKAPARAAKSSADATVQAPLAAARAARRGAKSGPSLRQPPQPRGVPQSSGRRQQAAPARRDLLATAVQAAAELTEIGLSAGARALREAVSRLPKP
jgi:hypothetical protein